MSAVLTLVACIEVGGLATIAFLVLNLGNLGSALLDIPFLNYLLTFFKISEEYILILFCSLIIFYSLFTIVLSTISIRRISIFSEMMGAKIKTSLLKHFLNLEWSVFLQSQSSKNISRVIHDGDVVADIINFFMNLLNKTILALIITIALFFFNASLTFWLATILAFSYTIIFSLFKASTKKNSLKITQYMDTTLAIVTNMFGSFKEIIFYNHEDRVLSNFKKVDSERAKLKGINMSMALMPRFFIDSVLLMMLVIASIFVTFNGSSASSFFATLSVYGIAALKLLPAFQNIFYFSYEIFARLPHLKNVTSLLAHPSNLKKDLNIEKDEADNTFLSEISFQNVSFAYKKSNKQSLKNLSLKIKKGKKIAVIGPTGSGKSTFVDLLLGMLEPDSGSIRLDNSILFADIFKSYRKNFSYVPQKIFFLEDTLRNNITFGSSEDIHQETFDQAISDSCLMNLIEELPMGIETPISDSNQMVSGGQKQCIGIARALYRGGDILILDEATSGMDTELEKSIYENIFNSNFKTIICITHKSSLLDRFDEIVVFNNGQIEASGSYKELIGKSEFFRTLSDKQSH